MSFVSELKRRNVIRVGAAYLIIGWLSIQVLDLAAESFDAPAWVMKMIITGVVIGFIPTLLFSWAYELTPDGLKKDSEVDQSTANSSGTAKKLDVITLVAVVAIACLIAWQQLDSSVKTADNGQLAEQAYEQQAALVNEPEVNVSDASIAVLPFADLSPGGDQGYFSDGVSEEILNVLVKIDGLKVASRTSAFAYKNSHQRIPEIASELGVRYVLEGSVRRAGETIRVTAQLIDATTDEHLLSETFDRTLTVQNVFAIQGDIAQLIVTALAKRIAIEDTATQLVIEIDTTNLSTLDLYYEANALFLLRGRENLTRALILFEKITETEPSFARGWTGLSAVYSVATAWGLAPRDYPALALQAANRAISIDPELSTPYAVLAHIEQAKLKPNWSLIARNFNHALRLNPDDANLFNWRALFWEETGFDDRAFEDYDICLAIDPSYLNCGYNKHALLVVHGREDEAAALSLSLLFRGATMKAKSPPMILGFVKRREDYKLLMSLNILINTSYPEQRWMVKELFQAFTDPNFKHAERLELFKQRYAKSITARDTVRSNTTDEFTILMAFRDFESMLNVPADGISFAGLSTLDGITKAQIREKAILSGLPEFWREQGFPPQCKAVGDDDFECD